VQGTQNSLTQTLIRALHDILKVRSIITLVTLFTFAYLAITSKIDTSAVVGFLNIILGFWFGEKITKYNLTNKGG